MRTKLRDRGIVDIGSFAIPLLDDEDDDEDLFGDPDPAETTTNSPVVMIDSREPKRLQALVRKAVSLPTVTGAMNSGDFGIPDVTGVYLGIERKTIRDFCSSLADIQSNGTARLWNQLERMTEDYTEGHRLLLVEGRYSMDATRHVKWSGSSDASGWTVPAMQMAQYSLQHKYGVRVLRTMDTNETVEVLRILTERGKVKDLGQ